MNRRTAPSPTSSSSNVPESRTETGEAPGRQGVTREHIGYIRPRNNAVRRDASPVECSGAFCHGLLGLASRPEAPGSGRLVCAPRPPVTARGPSSFLAEHGCFNVLRVTKREIEHYWKRHDQRPIKHCGYKFRCGSCAPTCLCSLYPQPFSWRPVDAEMCISCLACHRARARCRRTGGGAVFNTVAARRRSSRAGKKNSGQP